MVQKNLKEWDIRLPHAEFACNRTTLRATGYSPFEALYESNPLDPIDLSPLSTSCKASFKAEKQAKVMKRLHEQIRAHIEKVNEAYKAKANQNRKGMEVPPGDLVYCTSGKRGSPPEGRVS